MNRTLLVCFLLAVSGPSPAAEVQSAAAISIDYPVTEADLTAEFEPAMAAKEQGFDYHTPVLAAWRKEAKGLGEFLRLIPKLKLDGAFSEVHHEVMTHLLLRWGDLDFAKTIPADDPAVIADLKRHFSQHRKFPVLFPDTAKGIGIKN